MKKLLLLASLFVASYSVQAQSTPTITIINNSCATVYVGIVGNTLPLPGGVFNTPFFAVASGTNTTYTPAMLTWTPTSAPYGTNYTFSDAVISDGTATSCTQVTVGEPPFWGLTTNSFVQTCSFRCQPVINCSWSTTVIGANVTLTIY